MNIESPQKKQSIILSLLFFIHGMVYASLVPWLPEIKERFELSNSMVGIMVSAIPAGSITFGLLSKKFINLIGLYWATNITFLFLIICISIVPFSSSWYGITLTLFLFGVFDSWGDTCINVQAINVQKLSGQSLINRFHGAGSIGTIWGGLIAVSAIGIGLSMAKFNIIVLLINSIMLMAYIVFFRSEKTQSEIFIRGNIKGNISYSENQLYIIALILLVFTCGIEETASIWGAIYMKDYYAVSATVSGLPYLGCQICMVIGRIFGDYFTNKFGKIIILKCGVIIAALGVLTVISISSAVFTVLGFSLIGLGISVVFPLIISFIGQLPNINATNGITFATWTSRIGLLLTPPLLGMLADSTSLRAALVAILVGCLFILLLINILSGKLSQLDS
ncbi:MFS transporter [Yersinia aleksiciae]|uniref:Putative membrane transport protein n=2 Tax=Yersinia aleksiciae TaxID=263819 RepID=A0A0T9T0U4_YERAE|nr:MFS transporter [Yersinia aleksiciae]AKP34195.1 transporter [Yersinia aleksiciae]MDA5499040.1 MFS transporter [Yersinia aleksiciae]NIL00622.1 MFS transporter [Yersinia aleksiciae]CFQ35781.1 putative membrane transport protein [Yersinia aleksiciae]CNK54850.1 putative membrane transport protein [Yersinia aleksiciae]